MTGAADVPPLAARDHYCYATTTGRRSDAWSSSLPAAWDSPPAWTSMHRPGIARVQGDRLILDGTTVEEFEHYHLKTLKLVVKQLNERLAARLRDERRKQEAARLAEEAHQASIRAAAARLTFDD